jgi:hypothetical protein
LGEIEVGLELDRPTVAAATICPEHWRPFAVSSVEQCASIGDYSDAPRYVYGRRHWATANMLPPELTVS